MATQATTGQLIKALRQEQKLSQEALAFKAESSSRYISFIETGRAHPSRALLLRLANELGADGQVCNDLLVSASYSPLQSDVVSEQEQEEVLSILTRMINASPYPAVVTNRYGDVLTYNAAMAATIKLLLGSSDYLDSEAANMHLLELDPQLCRSHILNLGEQENYRLKSLRQECLRNPDDVMFQQLLQQLQQFQKDNAANAATEASSDEPHYFSQLHMKNERQHIRFYWCYGAIGSHADQLCEDLQVISAIPADTDTEQLFRQLT